MAGQIRLVSFGECMLELQGQAFGTMRQTFGGDSLNTAVYLARCGRGLRVDYATALGDEGLSAGMMARWQAEGIGLGLVRRIPGKLPGMYLIEVDGRGERRFSYWRDQSAARAYFDTAPAATPLEAQAGDIDALYLTGISLAILPAAGRERLFGLMRALRERGAAVIFDNNYRPRLWAGVDEARTCYERAFALASIALVSADDHQALLGLPDPGAAIDAARALPAPELVVKRGAASTLLRGARQSGTVWQEVATEAVAEVVDTTAAGDSFAAGYLSRRLAGASARESARFGNRLAARVIGHPGALIAAQAMADLVDCPWVDNAR